MAPPAVRPLALSLALSLLTWCRADSASALIDCLFTCTPPGSTACGCSDYDPSDECVINTIQNMPAGAVVDCTDQDVRLLDRVEVDNGFVTVRARDLIVEAAHRMKATRDQSGIPFGIILELTGKLEVTGAIEAQSNTGGGSVVVEAQGDILVNHNQGGDGILVNPTAPWASGGSIELVSGGSVLIDDPLDADGSLDGVSEGGTISISASGNVTIRDHLSAFGRQANAGVITVRSTNGIVDVQPSAEWIKAEGGAADGDGGAIYLTGTRLILGALLSAQGGFGIGGGLATGGMVHLLAGSGGIEINANIDVTGGEGGSGLDGGALIAESEGPLTIASGVSVLTKSDANGGHGGDIRLDADGPLTIGAATIDARGHWGSGSQGSGATIEIRACNLSIASQASIDARGYDGGTIVLTGRETLTVSASSTLDVTAVGGTNGEITLIHRAAGKCSADPVRGCDASTCLGGGTCSNDPQRTCTTNPDCNTGCGSGQCLHQCSDNPNRFCATDNDCTGCPTGQCTTGANPDTGGTTSQFTPTPPEIRKLQSLVPCN